MGQDTDTCVFKGSEPQARALRDVGPTIHTHTHFHTGPPRLPPSTVGPTLASRGMHSWHSELEFLEGVFSCTFRVHQEFPRALTLTHTG